MASYQPAIYREQGGARQVVGSGGSLDVESGGEIDIEASGELKFAGTAITASAAELNALASTGLDSTELGILNGALVSTAELNNLRFADKMEKVIKVALADADTGGGVFSWRNTEESADVLVTRLVIDLTTAASGACTLDCGQAATSVISDNLIDALDTNAATGVFDSVTEAGTNGKTAVKVADDAFVTGSMKTGAAAGTAGSAYIFYVVV